MKISRYSSLVASSKNFARLFRHGRGSVQTFEDRRRTQNDCGGTGQENAHHEITGEASRFQVGYSRFKKKLPLSYMRCLDVSPLCVRLKKDYMTKRCPGVTGNEYKISSREGASRFHFVILNFYSSTFQPELLKKK